MPKFTMYADVVIRATIEVEADSLEEAKRIAENEAENNGAKSVLNPRHAPVNKWYYNSVDEGSVSADTITEEEER